LLDQFQDFVSFEEQQKLLQQDTPSKEELINQMQLNIRELEQGVVELQRELQAKEEIFLK
jgi:hypothetical protein